MHIFNSFKPDLLSHPPNSQTSHVSHRASHGLVVIGVFSPSQGCWFKSSLVLFLFCLIRLFISMDISISLTVERNLKILGLLIFITWYRGHLIVKIHSLKSCHMYSFPALTTLVFREWREGTDYQTTCVLSSLIWVCFTCMYVYIVKKKDIFFSSITIYK